MDKLEESIAVAAERIEKIARAARHQRDSQDVCAHMVRSQMTALETAEQQVWVDAKWPIAWPDWPPGLQAKITALLQKIMRRALSWYIDPIVAQQNAFNEAALDALRVLMDDVVRLQSNCLDEDEELRERLDDLTKQIEVLGDLVSAREK